MDLSCTVQREQRRVVVWRSIQALAIDSSSGFGAESTRKIEDQTSHQNNSDCAAAEHRAAKVKPSGNEQKG